jgi:hypothetical protein
VTVFRAIFPKLVLKDISPALFASIARETEFNSELRSTIFPRSVFREILPPFSESPKLAYDCATIFESCRVMLPDLEAKETAPPLPEDANSVWAAEFKVEFSIKTLPKLEAKEISPPFPAKLL